MQDYDDPRLDRDIQDRLILVENSLLLLKAKSRYFADWDNSEVERLERLRSSLRARYSKFHERRTFAEAPSRGSRPPAEAEREKN
jgi:hypothetical protein